MRASSRPAGLLVFACAALTLATPALAGAQPPSLAFGACAATQVIVSAPGLQCATLDVPFDRADPGLGSIALAVQRVPASAPRTGAIVLLAGGPGQPALPAFESLLAPLAREGALHSFELIAFDQRGTGQSQALQCPDEVLISLLSSLLSPKGGLASIWEACGLALGPTRAFYSSQESAEDLDALRQALGGMPLSLLAVSYGTRVAGIYAREHPQGVARMVLDSPVPTTGSDPLGIVRLRALRRVLDEGICGAGACRSFSSDLYADLMHVAGKLHRHPLRARIYDERGRLRSVRVTETGVLRLLTELDLAPMTRELAPAAIAAAAHGDLVPLARLTYEVQGEAIGGGLPAELAEAAPALPLGGRGGGPVGANAPAIDSAISTILYLATYCAENELPWSPESPVATRAADLHSFLSSLPAGATAPFAPATAAALSSLPLCEEWPPTPPAPPSPAGVSATPTLILSGDEDLRTPYEQAIAIAAGYSDAQLLRVPGAGHSTVSSDASGCARKAMIEFLTSGQAPATCPGSSEARALALPPSSLAAVPAAASRSRLAGKVAAAAAMTLEDLLGQTGLAGGGLRGGRWSRGSEGFALHGMLDVPGVALSGSVHLSGTTRVLVSGRLTVRGRLAGALTLHGLALSGRVGGAHVHARLAAL